jgi:hypothetical protein
MLTPVVRPHPRLARTAMKPGDERRTEELGHLKLALATFALQLDAFELRTHEVLLAVEKPVTENPLVNGSPAHRRDRGTDDLTGGQ